MADTKKKNSKTKNQDLSVFEIKNDTNEFLEEKIETIEEIIVADNTSINELDSLEPEEQVFFSPYNPFIFQTKKHNSNFFIKSKKFKVTYNLIKFFVAFAITIIAIVALYFTSIWQTEIVNGTTVSGKDLFTKLYGLDLKNFVYQDGSTSNGLHVLSSYEYGLLMKINITNIIGSNFSDSIIQVIVAFSFVSIVSLIPLLIFKNGTIWSVFWISFAFVFVVVVFALFIFGINSYFKTLSTAEEIKVLLAKNDASLSDQIGSLVTKLVSFFYYI